MKEILRVVSPVSMTKVLAIDIRMRIFWVAWQIRLYLVTDQACLDLPDFPGNFNSLNSHLKSTDTFKSKGEKF